MQNPFGSQQVPGSYSNLKERMFKKVRSANVKDQILDILRKAYEDALAEEAILLSRAERNRLFFQVIRMVMEELLKGSDDANSA